MGINAKSMGIFQFYCLLAYFIPVLILGALAVYKFEIYRRLFASEDMGITFEEVMMAIFMWPVGVLFFIIEELRNGTSNPRQ